MSDCWVSVDGTDFRVLEPAPFDAKWFSHKFRGPGLRYEIGLSITDGNIVWAHGPFPCGAWADLRIFRADLKLRLKDGEHVLTDGGYRDKRCKRVLGGNFNLSARVKARHETLNRHLKQFRVLGNAFRHSLKKHSQCFFAVANLVEVMIESGESLFQL